MGRYQKGKTNLDFTEARDSEWQCHQLGHMQSAPCSRHITTPAPHHSVFFTGRMPFLPPNQQRQSTEGQSKVDILRVIAKPLMRCASKTRKAKFSGRGENCQRNVTDLAGSLVTSCRPPGRLQNTPDDRTVYEQCVPDTVGSGIVV